MLHTEQVDLKRFQEGTMGAILRNKLLAVLGESDSIIGILQIDLTNTKDAQILNRIDETHRTTFASKHDLLVQTPESLFLNDGKLAKLVRKHETDLMRIVFQNPRTNQTESISMPISELMPVQEND